ncbi:MAG: DUF3526 domain-containing protein [Bacteroidota bacterium]
MTQLLITNFLRSKGLMIGLLLIFLTGLVSLHIGKVFLAQQADIAVKTAHYQTEHHRQHLTYEHGEMGLLLYYIRFGLANEIPNIAGLSIGHRDIHPNVQLVNIRNLEEQKHATELRNPLYQLLGNLDFSFVLIYLFPLIIIAFCFNLLSEEKEGGTWTLVLSQAPQPLTIISTKLWIRLASILAVLFSLLAIGKVYLAIPLDTAFFAFTLVAVLYVLFWFALAWFVVSLQKSSSQNALSLLLAWVLLTIILPASINALVINLYPVPEAYSTVIESRDGYHNKWDLPKAPTIQKFKEHYLQFAQYEHPAGQSFGWFWYYAMQQMGDDEAAASNKAMKEKLQKRDQISRTIAYFFPSLHTQFSLNALSQSDMRNYLHFIEQLEAFHEDKRLYFYPKIFEETPIEEENWAQFTLEYAERDRKVEWFKQLLPLGLVSLLLVFLARGRWSTMRM